MTGRKSFYVFGCIAIVIAIACGNGTVVQGEQQKLLAEDPQNADFKDKIVVLDLTGGGGMNSESEMLILENARVLKMGNRDFIVGDALPFRDEKADFYKDVAVGAPCDDIITFRTMTRERFKPYLEKWKEAVED